MPFISICIPAYKRVNYLQRLLDSIAIQTFKDFEVIVTDDSNDSSVKNLLTNYENKFVIRYFQNKTALGTPSNWNSAILKAEGEWIKLIHDDDWLATPQSLQTFAAHTGKNKKFIFSAYVNSYENEVSASRKIYFPPYWKKRIIENPVTLIARNVIGPPSVTLLHSSIKEEYDERMKWRVDIDFYIRVLLGEHRFTYINEILIAVGIGELQVTNDCFENPSIEIPEGFLLLQKYGVNRLRDIWVYDAWWRLLRNMEIRNEKKLLQYSNEQWPVVIIEMIKHLNKIPHTLLKKGIISKTAMAVSYLINLRKIFDFEA